MSYRAAEVGSPLVHVALGANLVALVRSTGERVWHQQIASRITLRIVTDGDRVFALGHALVCLDARTGSILWKSGSLSLCETLLVDRELVFVGGQGELRCFAADTGRLLWSDGFKGMGMADVAIAVPGLAAQADVSS